MLGESNLLVFSAKPYDASFGNARGSHRPAPPPLHRRRWHFQPCYQCTVMQFDFAGGHGHLSRVTANNFRTTGSIHLKNSQNPKWLLVNCSQLLWPQVMSGQWPTTIVIPAFAGVSGYRPLAGRGAKSPQPITPEPMHSGSASQFRANLFVELFLLVKTYSRRLKGSVPPSNEFQWYFS